MYGDRVRNWLQRHWKKLALAGGCALLLLLFVILILPGIVRSRAEQALATALHRRTTIAGVSINPFGMTVTVDGIRLFEPDNRTPFVQLGQVRASLSIASLYRMAPVLDELTITNPTVRLVRTAANRYNFSDILGHLAGRPPAPDTGVTRFSINNISITGGSIDFDDRAVAGGKLHTIRDLRLTIPFISTIPYLAERYTDPIFSAVVNGAPLRFEGKAKPLAKAVQATIQLNLDRLDLPFYLPYLPAALPITLTKGTVSLNLTIAYRVHADKRPDLTVSGETDLENLAVSDRSGKPLASLARFALQARAIDPFSRLVDLDRVALDGLTIHLSRDTQGRLNLQRLLTAERKAAPPPRHPAAKTPPMPSYRFRLSSLHLKNGVVTFTDHKPKGGFTAALSGITLKAANISSLKDAKASYELALQGDHGERFNASGTAVITPLAATSRFALTDIKLQRGWPYLQGLLTRPVKGTLAVSGEARYDVANGLTTHNMAVTLENVAASYGARDRTRLTRLALEGIDFNQKHNRLEVGGIHLAKGTVTLSRGADGSLSPLALLVPQGTPAAPRTAPAPRHDPHHPAPAKPLSYRVRQIDVNGLNVGFTDNTFQDAPVFRLRHITLATGNLSGPRLLPMPLRFSATYGNNAPLQASGTLTPQPFHYRGSIRFSRLPIRDFVDYLPKNINILVVGGTLDSALGVDLGLDRGGKPFGSFAGKAGVRNFHIVDTVREEDLLTWESLQLDQIKGTIAPFSLGIRQIALNDVYSRIVVRKDGTLNLQNLVSEPAATSASRQQAAAPAGPAPSPPAGAAGAPATPPPAAPVSIKAMTIQNGTIAFSDHHLLQPFRTTFYRVGGRVTGLSSAMNSFADVDLRGNLENHSPLLIRGRINPLRNDLFVDLTISFKDIDLAPATPYSGTYLGYAIDKGKLYLDLKYHIEHRQLQASNKIFVDQFTFGPSVPSDKATSLPVRLGVALLKDRNGEIHLDLPVSGRTDDPQFSIWGVVWQVVKNLFIKAATSPFALLSSMLGSHEDLSAVHFAYGSSSLTTAQQQKLLTLAKGLNDRPALKVELKGYVDRERDPEGYRNALLEKKMRQEKYLALARAGQIKAGENSGPITIQPAEYSRYLKAVYQKEKFPKPRNFIGMVKDLPDAEMKKLILANTRVGDQELHRLAADRVATVRNLLITAGKMAPERLFLKAGDIYKAPSKEKGGAGRVELEPIAP